MAKEYVPIFYDWVKVTEELNDQEKGRLIDAIVLYATGGDWQERIKGNERYLFPAFREQINRNENISKARAAAGAIGGTANGSKDKQTEANGSKPKQTEAKSPKEKEKEEENKNKNKEEEEDISGDAAYAEARQAQDDHNRIMEAAENAGFPKSNTVRAKLLDAYAEHGKEKVLRAIEECATHSAASIAYLQAVLNGKPKLASPLGKLPAQQYEQRDYSEPEESIDQLMERLSR